MNLNTNMIIEEGKSFIWNDHYKILFDRIHQLFTSGHLLDVAIIAGNEQVYAHKAVLAAASPILQSQLQLLSMHPMEIHLDTMVNGCSGQEVNDIVQFIYCGKISIPHHRLSMFLTIARHLQLVGFHEAQGHQSIEDVQCNSQRQVLSSRHSLHISLPDNIPGPTLPPSELKTFIPNIALPIPPAFPMSEAQVPQSITQFPESATGNQGDCYMNFMMQENPPCNVAPSHVKYHSQDISGKALKYGEQIKSARTMSGSLSNASFSDLCSGESDLNMLFFGDNRAFASNVRHSLSDLTDNTIYTNNNMNPRDFSHGNIKIVSQGIFENETAMSSQGSAPVNHTVMTMNSAPGEWSNFTNTANEPEHFQRMYSIPNHDAGSNTVASSSCSNVLFTSNCTTNILQPQSQFPSSTHVDIEQPSLPGTHVSVQENNVTAIDYAQNANIHLSVSNGHWSMNESQPHRWCMPDQINDPKNTDSRQENISWSGGGRLKVKSSIGGVSVQDLSAAAIQITEESNQLQDLPAAPSETSNQEGTAALSKSDISSKNASSSTNPSCGKLIIRTDITADPPVIQSTDNSPDSNKIPFVKSTSSLGKTASISVVQSEQLMESSAFRDDNTSNISTLNKLSIVPETQLLESNRICTSSSISSPNMGNNVLKIQIRKQVDVASSEDYAEPTDLSTRVENEFDSTLNMSNSQIEDTQSDVEVVNSENDNSVVNYDNDENNLGQQNANCELEINHDRIFQMDSEEDLEVILTSSHQPHLYHYNYNINSNNYSYQGNITDIVADDSAKAQWDLLKQKQNKDLCNETTKSNNDTIIETKETKIKSSTNIHSPNLYSITLRPSDCQETQSDSAIILEDLTSEVCEESSRNTPFSVIELDENSYGNCEENLLSKQVNINNKQTMESEMIEEIGKDMNQNEDSNSSQDSGGSVNCIDDSDSRTDFANILSDQVTRKTSVVNSEGDGVSINIENAEISSCLNEEFTRLINEQNVNENVVESKKEKSQKNSFPERIKHLNAINFEGNNNKSGGKIIDYVSEGANQKVNSPVQKSLNSKNNSTDDTKGEFNIKCGDCSESFSVTSQLVRHCLAHYTPEKPFCCLCSKKMKSKHTLRVHIYKHIVEIQPNLNNSSVAHKCPKCSSVFTQRTNLIRHMGSRHQLSIDGTPLTNYLKCPECPYTCLIKYYLEAHVKTHLVDKAHKCPECPYQTSEKYAIDRHMRIHTKEKPYVCEICQFNASTPSILSRHKRGHTQEKPHVCAKCGMQYADAKRLRDHMYAHDNIKPFMCHICSFTSRRKDNLQVHIRKIHASGHKIKKKVRAKGKTVQYNKNENEAAKESTNAILPPSPLSSDCTPMDQSLDQHNQYDLHINNVTESDEMMDTDSTVQIIDINSDLRDFIPNDLNPSHSQPVCTTSVDTFDKSSVDSTQETSVAPTMIFSSNSHFTLSPYTSNLITVQQNSGNNFNFQNFPNSVREVGEVCSSSEDVTSVVYPLNQPESVVLEL